MNKTRIRDYGIQMGTFPCGSRNAITDVAGVTVGHCTIDTLDSKTGVTVILPSQRKYISEKTHSFQLCFKWFWQIYRTAANKRTGKPGISYRPYQHLKCRSGTGRTGGLYGIQM